MFATFQSFQSARKFGFDTSGSVAVISALCFTVLLTIAGASLDFSRMANTKSAMGNALDAAVLATGVEMIRGDTPEAELHTVFENYFVANMKGQGEETFAFNITSFVADPSSGEVSASVETDVPASLMRIAGFDQITVSESASSIFDIQDVEVAMMLDVTGSMSGSKITDLKLAATDAIDILIPNTAATNSVRIGLVPYSASVNAGNKIADKVTGSRSSSCVTERKGTNAFTDASHRVEFLGASASYCPPNRVIPLSSNTGTLKGEIKSFKTNGRTAGHLGVAWSYYVLSENWADVWPSASRPSPYDGSVKKIAILMTDGIFNQQYTGGNSSDYATATCAQMKKDDIIIYAVAFKAPSAAEKTLQNCANDDKDGATYFYSADSGSELRDAFRAIAGSITSLRITK
ncbi:MAG: pilus assembly protein [Pseudomonadota bacterium]